MTTREVVELYIGAWNARDEGERRTLLEQCWTDDGTYTDPQSDERGREQLSAHIEGLHGRMPGARFEVMAGPDHHHRYVRFIWRLTSAGAPPLEGMDVGELAPDGRLQSIVGFFSALPT
ncbi:MAG TPA: nuclear transport factor 2 family protein [Chloroflexota bacterium]|nr:nuclear transport factor 2 family protein [Chloroflexota bacterium]